MNMVLTQNFKTWATTMLLGATSVSTNGTTGNSSSGYYPLGEPLFKPFLLTSFKNRSGIESPMRTTSSGSLSSSSSLNKISNTNLVSNGYTHIEVGSGNTQASESDVDLASAYTLSTDYTVENVPNYMKLIDNKPCLDLTFTITAKNNITIAEIGMFFTVSNGQNNQDILFGRCVLDEPVALATGNNKTFEITVSLF